MAEQLSDLFDQHLIACKAVAAAIKQHKPQHAVHDVLVRYEHHVCERNNAHKRDDVTAMVNYQYLCDALISRLMVLCEQY